MNVLMQPHITPLYPMKRLFYIVSAILLLQACAASRNVRQNPDLGRVQDGNFKIEMQEIVTSDGEVHNAYGIFVYS